MDINLEPKRAFISRYIRDENFVSSLRNIPTMPGYSIFSQFWSIFCNNELLDFKCDIHSIMRSLFCNERGFLRIIDHMLIKNWPLVDLRRGQA